MAAPRVLDKEGNFLSTEDLMIPFLRRNISYSTKKKFQRVGSYREKSPLLITFRQPQKIMRKN